MFFLSILSNLVLNNHSFKINPQKCVKTKKVVALTFMTRKVIILKTINEIF